MSNFLKYTGLDVNTILQQITDKVKADTRFDNFRESAIAQTIMEVFAGTTDINNYYIQRRAEENFLDTAQLKSSIISIARQLGYVPSRPSPASANLRIKLKGDVGSKFVVDGDNKIQIPYYSKFSAEGNEFVLKQTMT